MTADEIERLWHEVLTRGHKGRLAFLPSSPRCFVCHQPFGGLGRAARLIGGYAPSRMNPSICNVCEDRMPEGGAEVDVAVVFADVRGSTAVAERMGAAAFAGLLNRFYQVARDVFLSTHCLINKMVGDEVVALYLPVMGADYRRVAAVSAARLMTAIGYGGASGPILPVGAGVHCGPAFVGRLGSGGVTDFTAVGDTVNTASRLQAVAAPGEVVWSEDAYAEVADRYPDAERREVAVKGKEAPLPVRVWRANQAVAVP